MKPCGRAQGRGIFLIDRMSQVRPDMLPAEAVAARARRALQRTPHCGQWPWDLNRPDRRARKGLDRERTDAQVAAWRREREERGVPALPAPCAPAKQAGAGGADRSALEGFVVSRYLERPLLLGGRKFDLRIYALVLSFQPLRAYLHRYPLAAWRPHTSVTGMLRLVRVCAHAALRQPLHTCASYCPAYLLRVDFTRASPPVMQIAINLYL